MIFNSLTYLVFLLSVVLLYWMLPYRVRLMLIFSSSLLFYGFWKIQFIPVMLLSVTVDYFVSIRIAKSSQLAKKKLLLTSLVVNLGLLFYFKYLIFFSDTAIGFANIFGANIDPIAMNIILPLGISFYTFQTISYTVDVYRGQIKPEKNFILYGCYVTFFPQLVAGPILRAIEVIPQFTNRVTLSWLDISSGLKRILYGLFLKVVVADNIAPLVDTGFLMPIEVMSALDVWTLSFLFGFQIYFDFSAYSHIALGSSRLLGIRFPENFNFPYVASSPKAFWGRWHISLSSWIRDYLYLPLAGIKVVGSSVGGLSKEILIKEYKSKKYKSLFLTWAIMGLWHGANWTFVLWGIYHSIVIAIYRLFAPLFMVINKRVKIIGGICVTLPIMMLSWIPFRAENLETTFYMWSKIFNPFAYSTIGMRENTYLAAAIILLSIFIAYLVRNWLIPSILNLRTGKFVFVLCEITLISIITPLIIIFLRPINQFIYFQF
jgi:alginate O-acetyltransferase complex protein AlgI